MKTLKSYDEQSSLLYRSLDGRVCFVNHLELIDLPDGTEAFTLEDSNRAELFVSEALKQRFDRSGAKGITFRKIGRVRTR